ncbi:hypothetical protein ACP4OV_010571 [Aristida adscensionis]
MATAADNAAAAAATAVFPDVAQAGVVRALVESGVTTIPAMFLRPTAASPATGAFSAPSIDLSLPRADTVALVRAGTVGAALSAARELHEQPLAVRSSVGAETGAVSYSTIPIPPPRAGQAATMPALPWRDSLVLRFGVAGDDADEFDHLPAASRDALLEYHRAAAALGREIAGLLSEALGVGAQRLEQATRLQGSPMACHYYPPCPEPARVVGSRDHTDASLFTVLALAQDDVGGLQLRLDDGSGGTDEEWMDVSPVDGALLINIGDVLKVISNDDYKSVEHRVVIKSTQDARVSIALFFNPAKIDEFDFFGPLPELVTAERPARYRSLTFPGLISYKRALGHARPSLHGLKAPQEHEGDKLRRGHQSTLRKVAVGLYHSAKNWVTHSISREEKSNGRK